MGLVRLVSVMFSGNNQRRNKCGPRNQYYVAPPQKSLDLAPSPTDCSPAQSNIQAKPCRQRKQERRAFRQVQRAERAAFRAECRARKQAAGRGCGGCCGGKKKQRRAAAAAALAAGYEEHQQPRQAEMAMPVMPPNDPATNYFPDPPMGKTAADMVDEPVSRGVAELRTDRTGVSGVSTPLGAPPSYTEAQKA